MVVFSVYGDRLNGGESLCFDEARYQPTFCSPDSLIKSCLNPRIFFLKKRHVKGKIKVISVSPERLECFRLRDACLWRSFFSRTLFGWE